MPVKLIKIILLQVLCIVLFGLVRAQGDGQATILRLENLIDQNGYYEYSYETSNGIVEEVKGEGGKSAQGFYRYTSPEGQLIQVDWVADEEGFKPVGDHLPTPHPAVARAIEYQRSILPQVLARKKK